jgi:flagellar protein FlaG
VGTITISALTLGTGTNRSPAFSLPGSGQAPAPTPPVEPVQPASAAQNADLAGHEAADRARRQVEAYLEAHDQGMKFNVDKASGLTVVHVYNRSTGEVVLQIPTEVVVRIAQLLKDQRPLVDTEA